MKILEVIYANVPYLLHGALITLLLSTMSVMLGMVVGLAVCGLQLSSRPFARRLGHAFVSVCRGLPLLVTLLIIFYVPSALGLPIDEWPAAILALTLNTGAYQAEIYRAGYSMIPTSQIEAARILKLNRWQIRFYIVAPQLFRLVLPPLTNAAIDIIKSSSLVSVIAVTDLLRVSQQLVAQTYRPVEIYITAAVFYVVLTLMISGIGRLAEKRLGMGFGR
jgi:polar amino acid transport system permease protein